MQLCNLHLVVCVNQSSLTGTTSSTCLDSGNSLFAMLVLGGCFILKKEITAKLGDGQTIHSGPLFVTLRYKIGAVVFKFWHKNNTYAQASHNFRSKYYSTFHLCTHFIPILAYTCDDLCRKLETLFSKKVSNEGPNS